MSFAKILSMKVRSPGKIKWNSEFHIFISLIDQKEELKDLVELLSEYKDVNFIEKYPSYIYTLKGPDVAELAQRIGTDIYSSDRSFIGSYSDRRYFTPVLFQRNSIIFLVMYEAMNCGDYAEKSISYQLDDISLLTDFESLDEIDFAMFD